MRLANTLVTFLSFAIILIFGPYSVVQTMVLGFLFFVGWGAVTLVYRLEIWKTNKSLVWMLNVIVGYYLFAFPFKFAAGLFLADSYWVVPRLIFAADLVHMFPSAFLISTLGFLGLLAGVLLSPFRGAVTWKLSSQRPRVRLLIAASIFMLVAKYYLKSTFQLGIPGVEALSMGIANLSGATALVLHSGALMFFNLLLFLGLTKRNLALTLFGLMIAFLNAIIDLRFGTKATVIYQVGITALYIFMVRETLSIDVRRSYDRVAKTLGVVLSIAAVIVLSTYRFVNTYRNALNSGYGIDGAISVALSSGDAESKSSVMEVFNRIIGIETLGALMPIGNGLTAHGGIMAMIDGSFVSSVSELILGTEDALTKFSVTQFGYFFFTGGYAGLILGSFILGILFLLCQSIIARAPFPNTMRLAQLPVLWILFVNVLMGGGNFFLTIKELSVVLAMFFVWSWIAVGFQANRAAMPRSGGRLARA